MAEAAMAKRGMGFSFPVISLAISEGSHIWNKPNDGT